jgi:hypothetical protein
VYHNTALPCYQGHEWVPVVLPADMMSWVSMVDDAGRLANDTGRQDALRPVAVVYEGLPL